MSATPPTKIETSPVYESAATVGVLPSAGAPPNSISGPKLDFAGISDTIGMSSGSTIGR